MGIFLQKLLVRMLPAILLAGGAAQASASPAENAYLIRNVRIFDGRSEQVQSGEVLVLGSRILAVSRLEITPPEGVTPTVIDGGGRLLMPGFIDAHVHMTAVMIPADMQDNDPAYVAALEIKGARAALLRGFTTQRDTGGAVAGLKKAIDEGVMVGPRVYPSEAVISQTSGHGDDRHFRDLHPRWGGNLSFDERRGDAVIADGVPEVLAAAREQLRHGAVQIKVMASGGASSEFDPLYVTEYTPEELRAAVEVASSFGTYVTVHSYNSASTRRAIEAGVRCIEHGHLIDEPTMKLFTLRARWFTPLEIMRQATSGNAELLAMSGIRNPYPGKLGVIEPGAYADLLLVNGDPFADISILEHPDSALALIMKDGRIYKDLDH